jgi:ketosteroid isomerase-like protein
MSAIEEAKRVIESHERFAAAQDMEGILSNMAEDAIFLAPDMALVEGHQGIRAPYDALFAMGTWQFGHDYSGASEIGDLVLLHGVARGTLIPKAGDASPFANNFMITLRRQPSGRLLVWRAAFAPSGESTV